LAQPVENIHQSVNDSWWCLAMVVALGEGVIYQSEKESVRR
jgi:hypothetical protein